MSKDVHPYEDPIINQLAKLPSVSEIYWTPSKHHLSLTINGFNSASLDHHIDQVKQRLTNFKDHDHYLTDWQVQTVDLIPAEHWWYPKQSAEITLKLKLTDPNPGTKYYQRTLTYVKR